MFERTGVTRRNLLGKDGVLRCEVEGVYKKKMVLIERGETDVYHWLPRAVLYLDICSRIL